MKHVFIFQTLTTQILIPMTGTIRGEVQKFATRWKMVEKANFFLRAPSILISIDNLWFWMILWMYSDVKTVDVLNLKKKEKKC